MFSHSTSYLGKPSFLLLIVSPIDLEMRNALRSYLCKSWSVLYPKWYSSFQTRCQKFGLILKFDAHISILWRSRIVDLPWYYAYQSFGEATLAVLEVVHAVCDTFHENQAAKIKTTIKHQSLLKRYPWSTIMAKKHCAYRYMPLLCSSTDWPNSQKRSTGVSIPDIIHHFKSNYC